ncbi:MAG: transposase [Rhodospirillales bacterium]|nr:MAG: transposase [Rhodospirillales bacterium]
MARRRRIHIDGAFYHVMLRGNGGQAVFADDSDRRALERLLAEGVERHGHRLHAYCWMTNHLHLCVQVGATPLAPIVQNLAFRHARRLNRRGARIGHLFQGRYRALLVADESYLLALVRYIHRNPVAAGLVADAADWRWSSHAAYLGRRPAPPWLTTAPILARLAADPTLARRRMAAWVADGSDDPAAGAEFAHDADDATSARDIDGDTWTLYAEAFEAGDRVLGPEPPPRRTRDLDTAPWFVGAAEPVPFRPPPRGARRQRLGLAPPPPSPAALLAAARALLAPPCAPPPWGQACKTADSESAPADLFDALGDGRDDAAGAGESTTGDDAAPILTTSTIEEPPVITERGHAAARLRGAATALALDLRVASLAEMARELDRDASALGRAVARFRAALAADPALAARYAAASAALIATALGSGLQNGRFSEPAAPKNAVSLGSGLQNGRSSEPAAPKIAALQACPRRHPDGRSGL